MRSCLSCKLLDVVNDKHINHLIEVDKVGNLSILIRSLELCLKLIHRDIQHLKLGVTLANLMTYSLHNVCLTKSRVTIDIQWIEGIVTWRYGDSHTCRTSQAVTLSLDVIIKGVVRI